MKPSNISSIGDILQKYGKLITTETDYEIYHIKHTAYLINGFGSYTPIQYDGTALGVLNILYDQVYERMNITVEDIEADFT